MANRPMINRQAVRRFLLEYAQRNRTHKYTRVGDGVYDQIEVQLREQCRRIVDTQPSAGKTIK